MTTQGETKWTKEIEAFLNPPDPVLNPESIEGRLEKIEQALTRSVAQPGPPNMPHSLKEAIDIWAKGRAVSASTKTKDRNLTAMLASCMPLTTLVGDIDEQAVRQLQADLRDAEYANSTNNEILRKLLLPVLDTTLRQNWITFNPVLQVKPLKKAEPDRRQPDWEMALQIVSEASRYSQESSELLRAMLLFGVGQAEIRTVQGEDFNFGRREIHFQRIKTHKPFDIPFYSHAQGFIDGLKAGGRLQIGRPVFKWRDPERAFRNACARLGVEHYELRALRRVLIIRLLEQNVDPRLVAEWQGHRDATLIFKVYGKWISPKWRREQIAKISAA